MALPTNFIDDILASSNLKRKYKMVNNPDGTVSFDDVTDYQQIGSEFGAKQMNETNGGINEINDKRLKTLNEVNLTTQLGFFVDALAVKELKNKTDDQTVVGNKKNATILVSVQTIKFTNGAANINLTGIANAYQKTVEQAIVSFQSSKNTIITETRVSKNTVSVYARDIDKGTPFSSDGAVLTLFLFLA